MVSSFVLGGAGIAFIQVPAAALVSQWFLRSRGAAMGVISAGASASAIVFYPVNTYLIVAFGWRTALAFFGLRYQSLINDLLAAHVRRMRSA